MKSRTAMRAEPAGGACKHLQVTRVIDKLGPMRDTADGRCMAQVLESHWRCEDCQQVVAARAHVDVPGWRWIEDPPDTSWMKEQEVKRDYSPLSGWLGRLKAALGIGEERA